MPEPKVNRQSGTPLRRCSRSHTSLVKFIVGGWDNEADEKVIESVPLRYAFLELGQ